MKLLFFPMAASPGCPIVTSRSGGIGRRAWFRSMYPQGCGGSSPFFGTSSFLLNNLAAWCPPWCPEISGLVSTLVSTGHHDAFFARNFLRMDNHAMLHLADSTRSKARV